MIKNLQEKEPTEESKAQSLKVAWRYQDQLEDKMLGIADNISNS